MLLLLNVVGLTPALLSEHCPTLHQLAKDHGVVDLTANIPALTLPAQATILTGLTPEQHGIVANGWLFRETMEPRLWQQSRTLCSGEFFYEKAQRAGLKVAKMFWWFNQGCIADYSATPKPYYSCDGNKAFGIHGTPHGFTQELEQNLGTFPFPAFWGPEAGARSSEWIARATEHTLKHKKPDLAMAYIPHLDYDLQRFGGTGEHITRNMQELEQILSPLLGTARELGYKIMIVSEYGISDVEQPVFINNILREADFLQVRPGPFGEILETFNSRAFAVADHQIAHIYVKNAADIAPVKKLLQSTKGIATVLEGKDRAELSLEHPRSGELVALANQNSWFTWQYHKDTPPDFAGTVDIHRKPGYDPAELFYQHGKTMGRIQSALCLLRKKLGLRYRFNVISTDPTLVKGSHGLPASNSNNAPLMISTAGNIPNDISMQTLGNYILQTLGI